MQNFDKFLCNEVRFTVRIPADTFENLKAEAREMREKKGHYISINGWLCHLLKQRYRRKKK